MSLPPWKRSFQKYSRNLSTKISLLKIAPDLLKSQSHVYSPKILRIICVMALFLNDSVHYLIPWRVRKVNPVWIYVQIANATTQGYLSPNNAWKKTQHNVPRKGQNCFLPLPHHCVGKNIPRLIRFLFSVGMLAMLAWRFVLARVFVFASIAPIGIFSLHLPLIGNAPPHHWYSFQCWCWYWTTIRPTQNDKKIVWKSKKVWVLFNLRKQIACDLDCEILQKWYCTAFSRWPAWPTHPQQENSISSLNSLY